MYQLIIQDATTLKVIGLYEIKEKEAEAILQKEELPREEWKDVFVIKEIYQNKSLHQILVTVKVSKHSSEYITTEFSEPNYNPYAYLRRLEKKIKNILEDEIKSTHIHSIVKKGKPKIAQKFGEEAVELVIEAGKTDQLKFIDEAADVFYYYLILLHERGVHLGTVLDQLKNQKRRN